GPSWRISGPFRFDGRDLTWRDVAGLSAAELAATTGETNPEFLAQVASSHEAMTAIMSARAPRTSSPLLDSEQSLLTGHRFHPSPKARQGSPESWLPYAPETGARFRLTRLAVAPGLLCGEGPFPEALADGLPVHPWQWRLLRDRPVLRRALEQGLIEVFADGPEVVPTSSVRTVHVPESGMFAKFSLDVRITNCVRKNSWYELEAAPALTRLLKPIMGGLLLGEPAYRTVALADRALYEGLGVILREGAPDDAVVAAALTDPGFLPSPLDPAEWFAAYVEKVAVPVLEVFFAHGVVLEPHLQNVLVVPGPDGLPDRAVFRDLEGTKLLPGRDLAALPERVRDSVTYDEERGWNRVAYCLFVNHLAEIAVALGTRHPGCDRDLWTAARKVLSGFSGQPRMRAVLAGAPLTAKANLLARWSRSADRAATYVEVPNPLGR
ncbi:IucA/IucC family protein, partial [Actinocorallia lasiicapitis]